MYRSVFTAVTRLATANRSRISIRVTRIFDQVIAGVVDPEKTFILTKFCVMIKLDNCFSYPRRLPKL